VSNLGAVSSRDELMQGYLASWNSHDPAAVAGFFAEAATYDDRGAGEIVQGPAAIRDHAASVIAAFPDLYFELIRAAHGEDFTAGHWKASMTHRGELSGLRGTGRPATSEGVDVATLGADGKISHLVSFYDGAAIMRDLGVLPARGSGLERALVRAVNLRPAKRS
jgi:steroid delta-isomerase-like uncharacterized protein